MPDALNIVVAVLFLVAVTLAAPGTARAAKICYVEALEGSSSGHRLQRAARAAAWVDWQNAVRGKYNRRMPYRNAVRVNGYPKLQRNNRRWSAVVQAYPCFTGGVVCVSRDPCSCPGSRAEALRNGCSSWQAR